MWIISSTKTTKSNLASFPANAATWESLRNSGVQNQLLSLHSDSVQPLPSVVSYAVFNSVLPFQNFTDTRLSLYQDLRRRRLGRCGRRLGFLLKEIS
ncbi:hypothetical protein L2E82_34444 [Cichorium intybus]|uniref:Uncharacterized protein n=1 Tax=Cichorium intybus TaxID=13427 RepID=A0ACB9BMD7_CICIN|nr:hypothetical protein L2E82_34444 [Cichorium intybus]